MDPPSHRISNEGLAGNVSVTSEGHLVSNSDGHGQHQIRLSLEVPSIGLTLRAVLVGLLIGVVVCVSNIYFGLQIGWSAQMSMQSSLLGFVVFKALSRSLKWPFGPEENVLVQTVAGAVGCMPITAGFLGVIPALEYLLGPEDNGPLRLNYSQLLLWSLGLCLFGLIWGMMLRQQFVVREKLPWPGAVATATMISVLHSKEEGRKADPIPVGEEDVQETDETSHVLPSGERQSTGNAAKIRALIVAAASSSAFSLFAYFVPMIHDLPLFGDYLASKWWWTVNVSPGFVGSGIITGLVTPLHMLAGSIVGWAILSPIAKTRGWAPGDVDDWEHGARGWIMWPSLAALMTDCLIKLTWLVVKPVLSSSMLRQSLRAWYGIRLFKRTPPGYAPVPTDDSLSEDELATPVETAAPKSPTRRSNSAFDNAKPQDTQQENSDDGAVGVQTLGFLLAFSVCVCSITVKVVFGSLVPTGALIVAIALSLPLSIMGIRAVAETDWNPVSGIGKVSQLVFALMIPRSNRNQVIINLVAGALAEAGASQSGDVSHDLKIGYLIGAKAQDQFYGEIIGSVVGSFIATAFYRLYTSVYEIPGKMFQIPVSYVWLLSAKLVTGTGLPKHAAEFTLGFAIFFGVGTIVKIYFAKRWWHHLIPGGVAFAVGMYNPPSFSIARAAGGIIYWYCVDLLGRDRDYIIVIAGGLVLGEGLTSMLNLGLTAAGVPHL